MKKVDEAIKAIKELQLKYCTSETMFIYKELDQVLNKIGWIYANQKETNETSKT